MKIKTRIAIANCTTKGGVKRVAALHGVSVEEALELWASIEKAWPQDPEPKPQPPTPLAPQDK